MEERKDELLKLQKVLKKRGAVKIPGKLHVSLTKCKNGKKRIQYYVRENSKDKSGKYIKKRDLGLAEKLAQQEYEEKMLCYIEKEIKMIDYFLKNINETAVYQPYLRLPEGKRKLVHPTIPDDELFIQEWLNEPHVNSKYREDELTYKIPGNERVRSKSEIIIAGILDKYNIPYKYEMPILNNRGRILSRPDFTVLNVRKRKVFYWEHFGMMDDNEYVNKTIKKSRMYTENGIYLGQSLICTYESLENPIDVEDVERIVKAYLL